MISIDEIKKIFPQLKCLKNKKIRTNLQRKIGLIRDAVLHKLLANILI